MMAAVSARYFTKEVLGSLHSAQPNGNIIGVRLNAAGEAQERVNRSGPRQAAVMCATRSDYGDIQGLVTLEDILEEIVGEFTSEPLPAHADVRPDTESDGYLVNASANVRALNRMMNWHLPTDGPKTLNGLILEQLEAIPKTGTGLKLSDYPVEILQTSESVVKTVRIRLPLDTQQAAAG